MYDIIYTNIQHMNKGYELQYNIKICINFYKLCYSI